MPLSRYTAVQFRRPMIRGLNDPFLILAEPEEGGGRLPLVVKPTAGFGDRPEAILRELFALLLARKLGLFAPEPVIVRFPDGFHWAAMEHDGYPELIEQSPGWNLATAHLGNDWKAWTDTSPPRSVDSGQIETVYGFDAMIQNSDREAENPNLLWREDQLAVLDFDRAFAFLRTEEETDRPWRHTLPLQNLGRHCLFRHLPELKDGVLLGRDLWDRFEEWWLERPSGSLSTVIGDALADPDLDLPRLEGYLSKLATGLDDFFPYLTEASRS